MDKRSSRPVAPNRLLLFGWKRKASIIYNLMAIDENNLTNQRFSFLFYIDSAGGDEQSQVERSRAENFNSIIEWVSRRVRYFLKRERMFELSDTNYNPVLKLITSPIFIVVLIITSLDLIKTNTVINCSIHLHSS